MKSSEVKQIQGCCWEVVESENNISFQCVALDRARRVSHAACNCFKQLFVWIAELCSNGSKTVGSYLERCNTKIIDNSNSPDHIEDIPPPQEPEPATIDNSGSPDDIDAALEQLQQENRSPQKDGPKPQKMI